MTNTSSDLFFTVLSDNDGKLTQNQETESSFGKALRHFKHGALQQEAVHHLFVPVLSDMLGIWSNSRRIRWKSRKMFQTSTFQQEVSIIPDSHCHGLCR